MNLPDITLLFQMGHFVIAYIILRRFVFVPALNIIESDQCRVESLQHKIDKAQQDYQELLGQQNQKWRFIKLSLRDMIPNINEKICINQNKISMPGQQQDVVISQKQKEVIKQMLCDELLDVGR